MFVAIFNYIEHLFDLIKPKKFFFMAIDGVAPRAKMNQQRARRFRSALDAEVARKKAREAGLVVPDDPFDSNAITPGTEFMAKLTMQLKYFINRKVSEDTSWQNIEVILSGHEVPGEGEHKIMEQIRIRRAEPDYSPDVRHCLYGLDADLIMLGLLSHDPHFALLREEVEFGRTAKKSKELTDQRFYLLHLSLVREYIELEFEDVKDVETFAFDFERLLDDFILISYFIGNDFLPELPSLLINEGALPIIFQTYKRYLRRADGYINDGGLINFERLAIWLEEMSRFEHEKFEEFAIDLEWFNKELDAVAVKTEDKRSITLTLTPREKTLTRQLKPLILSLNNSAHETSEAGEKLPLCELPDIHDVEFVRTLCSHTYTRVFSEGGLYYIALDAEGIPADEDLDAENQRLLTVSRTLKKYENALLRKPEEIEAKKQVYDSKFDQWRNGYYKQKFGITLEDENVIKDITENYLEGLQWVLLYYYRGVASWGWYYRYHYAPKITDIRKGLTKKFSFQLGAPFKPFEQLMGVLPERSKALVPPPYRTLMSEESSPIIDFYPKEFALDLNGKKNDWEAVVKIPFVDEKRLRAALAPKEAYLTPDERKRNSFGKTLRFVYNPQTDFVYPSSLPGVFQDIAHSHCIEVPLETPTLGNLNLKLGLIDDVKLGKEALGGFPTLKTLTFTAKLENAGIQVSQRPSKNESLILTINNNYANESPESVASKILGDSIYVGWPYLREAKLVALTDELFRYELSNGHIFNKPHPPRTIETWHKDASRLENSYAKTGSKIGKVQLIAHVCYLKGLRRTAGGAYEKDFGASGDEEHVFPIQTIVEDVVNKDERFVERDCTPVNEEFPLESQAVFLGPAGYGNPVTIKGHGQDTVNIQLMKLERGEPAIGSRMAQYEKQSTRYFASYDVAKMLGIHPLALSKITSKCLVQCESKKIDVGLNLKFEARRLKVLHHSRRSQRGWDFSTQAVELIRDYRNAFPKVLNALSTYTKSDIPDLKDLLKISPQESKDLGDKIRKWIGERTDDNPGFEQVPLESDALSSGSIKKIETYIIKYLEGEDPVKIVAYNKIPRAALLAPSHAYHELRTQRFSLGDRVVSALSFGKVKLFNRGTVIGINSSTFKVTLDVLFDHAFDAGTDLGGKITTKRGLTVDAGSVINLTDRQLVYHTKKSMEMHTNKSKAAGAPKLVIGRTPSTNVWNKGKESSAPTRSRVLNQGLTNKVSNSKAPLPDAKPVGSKPFTAEKKLTILKKESAASQASQPVQSAANDEKARQDLLAMLHGPQDAASDKEAGSNSASQTPKPKSNEEVLKNIKPVKSHAQLQRNLLGAVYGQYVPLPPRPPPPPTGMRFNPAGPFPPAFVPGMIPMPPPPMMAGPAHEVDAQASAELLAALNVGGTVAVDGQTNGHPGDHPNGLSNGNPRGRGGYRGRGRGRGRGGRS